MGTERLKVVFAVTEDWYFRSHRKPMASCLQSMGCEIVVATRFNVHRSELEAAGFKCVSLPFERSLKHPVRDALALWQLSKVIRDLQPDIVHLVSLKPMLLGAFAILTASRARYVGAFTGMGYLFSSDDRFAGVFRRAVVALLRLLFGRAHCWIIVQNEDDLRLLAEHSLGSKDRTILIPGVGVDLKAFPYTPPGDSSEPVVLLPARLIRDKGIEEFVSAAAIVKQTDPAVRFIVVGGADPDNPAGLSDSEIEVWQKEGHVEWWGHRGDMAELYRLSSLVCLPSYREGLPKVLLEASACGRPIIASDVPGCRDICRDAINGILVPPRDANALAAAIKCLLADSSLRSQYGTAGRQIVETEYSVEHISRQTLNFYESVRGGE